MFSYLVLRYTIYHMWCIFSCVVFIIYGIFVGYKEKIRYKNTYYFGIQNIIKLKKGIKRVFRRIPCAK